MGQGGQILSERTYLENNPQSQGKGKTKRKKQDAPYRKIGTVISTRCGAVKGAHVKREEPKDVRREATQQPGRRSGQVERVKTQTENNVKARPCTKPVPGPRRDRRRRGKGRTKSRRQQK